MPVNREALKRVHLRMPNRESLSLIRNPNTTSTASFPVPNCTPRNLSQREINFAGLGTEPYVTAFGLHELDLGGAVPAAGDWLVRSDLTMWSIRSLEAHLYGTRYDCVCTKLSENADSGQTDTTAPVLIQITAVASPTNEAVDEITYTFSEDVTGFSIGDLSLTLNGGGNLLTSETITAVTDAVYTLSGLAALTAAAGDYVLTLTATGSGIADAAGNVLASNTTLSWSVDVTAPTVQILAVIPDPRDTAVASIVIQFSERVVGFDLDSLTLTKNGGPNLLTSAQMLGTADGIVYSLSGLTGLTGTAGTYVLTLIATGIADLAGNALAAGASETWVYSAAPPPDLTVPTASIIPVAPDPHGTAVNSLTIVFSEPVTGVTLADFTLKRDGGANLLTVAQLVSTADNQIWLLSNLGPITGTAGTYVCTLVAAGSGIQDAAANLLAVDAAETWVAATLPEWPANTPSNRMLGHYGDNGFDVGATGASSYATIDDYWYADWWMVYYAYRATVLATGTELSYDGTVALNTPPRRISDPIAGSPGGPACFNGTLSRIEATRPGSAKCYYTTLTRTRTPTAIYNAGAWPVTSGTYDAGYLPTWLNPPYNEATDAWFGGEYGIAYQDADCRLYHGRRWAANVAAMKDLHPQLGFVFSDNFADNTAGGFNWVSQMALVDVALTSLRQEHGVALGLVINTTSRWTRVISGYGSASVVENMDHSEAANLCGLFSEGIGHAKFMLTADHDIFFSNLLYWLEKDWPGGGKRFFGTQSRSEIETAGDVGGNNCLNRTLTVVSTAVSGNNVDVVLSGPHYLADSSYWRARVSAGFHPTIAGTGDNNWQVIPHPDANPNRIRLGYTSPPASGYGTGSGAVVCFVYSGHDVDAAVLHSIRRPEHCCRAFAATGLADSRGTVEPLWVDWADTYGFAIGPPVRTLSYTLAGNPWGTDCAALTRTPFAGGNYLWIDWRREARRAWWGTISG